jgi:cell wall-associated NlpC family hydrolase
MSSPTVLLASALTWLHTPFHEGAALKGIGCDCYGLIRGVAAEVFEVGLMPLPLVAVGRWSEARQVWPVFAQDIDRFAHEIPLGEAAPGDILVFGDEHGALLHTGILINKQTFLHSIGHGRTTGVHLARFEGAWAQRHRRTYRYESAIK